MIILFIRVLYLSSLTKEDKIGAMDYNKFGGALEENIFS